MENIQTFPHIYIHCNAMCIFVCMADVNMLLKPFKVPKTQHMSGNTKYETLFCNLGTACHTTLQVPSPK